MTPERWQRIDGLLQEAIGRPRDERAAFLDEVCADEASRKEVESLISFHDQAANFLEVPAFEAAAGLLADQVDSLVGLAVGSYRIEKLLGAGGMGEVYLAGDMKLDRSVAIKFLPAYLEADELAKRRLVREARAAAKLEHPNICATYEVAEEASRSFIVMQYVEGETLACRIQRRPLELRESLEVALQVADALAEAHSHGIVHRDIKPQNIMITPRGQVKVLDFGLAKVVRSTGLPEHEGQLQSVLSAPGIVVGTAPYMSPEQAKGVASVDARSDLFSIGVVLYESIAGRLPFSGASAIEMCSQVIHVDPPPPSQFNPHIPPELDDLTSKALAKQPDARYQSASELLEDLRKVHARLQAEDHVLTKPIPLLLRTSKVRALTTLSNMLRRPRVVMPATLGALAVATVLLIAVPMRLRATLHRPPSEALRWYTQGTGALRDGLYYKASNALQNAVDVSSEFALAHASLAEAMTELDYTDKANYEIIRARALVRDLSRLPSLDALYLQAITDIVSRDFEHAIESYQEIAHQADDSEKAFAYVDLGRAYEKNDQIDKAIESYLTASELAPDDPAAFLRLGILYIRKQESESAEAAFQKAQAVY
ncbi:MAG: serine/threonine-protein kinase, partial [Blastocatellia bacterium]